MSYRIRFPREEENELERVPLEVALEMERQLSAVAASVPVGPPTAIAVKDFVLEFAVDAIEELVLVRSVRRAVAVPFSCGCDHG